MTVDRPERTTAPESASGTADTPAGLPGGRPGAHSGPDANGSGFGWLVSPNGSRSRRSAIRIVAALGIAVAFAVVIGLLIAVLASGIGEDSDGNRAQPPALTIPSAGGGPAAGPVQVPPDWTPQTSNRGIAFSSPPGWTQRTDALVDFRVAPAPNGGPGVEQLGVGFSSAGDPQTAAASYARNTYSGQPGYSEQGAADQAGARGERGRQVRISYSREGVPVQVVIRAYPSPQGVLLLATRATTDNPQRAEELVAQLDASVRLP